MRVEQEIVYMPITIVLETLDEAKAFFDLIDMVDDHYSNEVEIGLTDYTPAQRDIVIKLSNLRTDGKIGVPRDEG